MGLSGRIELCRRGAAANRAATAQPAVPGAMCWRAAVAREPEAAAQQPAAQLPGLHMPCLRGAALAVIAQEPPQHSRQLHRCTCCTWCGGPAHYVIVHSGQGARLHSAAWGSCRRFASVCSFG